MRALPLILTMLLVPSVASAWDEPASWYAPATAANPGGGGIIGTGGQRDHGITCLDCHRERVDTTLAVRFTFTPPLDETGGGEARYTPGQRYRVGVTMLNERLGPPCPQFVAHHNNFAANFELTSGAPAGILESDSGQSQAACPPAFTNPGTGTTALYGDCAVVFPRRGESMTAWTFFWTAPASSTEVRMFYGATDGDCRMTSLDDAVVVGKRTLVGPRAAAMAPRSRRVLTSSVAALFAVSLSGFALLIWTRRRA